MSMQLARLRPPFLAAAAASGGVSTSTTCCLALRPAIQSGQHGNSSIEGRRYASVKAQGAYKIPNKKTLPKKLGAKRTGGQHVLPGNIIFKQRGTIWHAGENAMRGRDHTIHASVEGYVQYYRDPRRHPDKQFIGVAFNKTDTLPYPYNGVRRRKLGMTPVARHIPEVQPLMNASGLPRQIVRPGGLLAEKHLYTPFQLYHLNKQRTEEYQEAAAAARNGSGLDGETTTTTTNTDGAPGDVKITQSVINPFDPFSTEHVRSDTSKTTPFSTKSASSPTDTSGPASPEADPKFLPLIGRNTMRAIGINRHREGRLTRIYTLHRKNYSYHENPAVMGTYIGPQAYVAANKLGSRRARTRAFKARVHKKLVNKSKEKEKKVARRNKEAAAEKAEEEAERLGLEEKARKARVKKEVAAQAALARQTSETRIEA